MWLIGHYNHEIGGYNHGLGSIFSETTKLEQLQ